MSVCLKFGQSVTFFKQCFQAVILPTRKQTTTWTDRLRQTETQIYRTGTKREQGVERQKVKYWKMAVDSYIIRNQLEINQSINQQRQSINRNIQGNTFGFLLLVYSIIKFLIVQKSIKYLRWSSIILWVHVCAFNEAEQSLWGQRSITTESPKDNSQNNTASKRLNLQ